MNKSLDDKETILDIIMLGLCVFMGIALVSTLVLCLEIIGV